jgi:hypothetical protein
VAIELVGFCIVHGVGFVGCEYAVSFSVITFVGHKRQGVRSHLWCVVRGRIEKVKE